MVLKVSKRGVRSGNTLKASNTRFLRQYRYVLFFYSLLII